MRETSRDCEARLRGRVQNINTCAVLTPESLQHKTVAAVRGKRYAVARIEAACAARRGTTPRHNGHVGRKKSRQCTEKQ
jgi:hypothetical protein